MCLAGKRRSDITGLTQPILSLGCRPRRIGVNLDKNAAALAGRIGDAREGFFDQRALLVWPAPRSAARLARVGLAIGLTPASLESAAGRRGG